MSSFSDQYYESINSHRRVFGMPYTNSFINIPETILTFDGIIKSYEEDPLLLILIKDTNSTLT